MDIDIEMLNFAKSIKRISNGSSKPKDNMIFGKVTKIKPLNIDIGGNIILTEDFLFLGQMCRPHKVKIPHTHEYNGTTENSGASGVATGVTNKGDLTITGQVTVLETNGHNHKIKEQVTEDVHKSNTTYEKYVTIEIEPKLKVGDTVLMFAMNNLQMYYVAERIEKE